MSFRLNDALHPSGAVSTTSKKNGLSINLLLLEEVSLSLLRMRYRRKN
jgi:hypothetical protein